MAVVENKAVFVFTTKDYFHYDVMKTLASWSIMGKKGCSDALPYLNLDRSFSYTKKWMIKAILLPRKNYRVMGRW